LNILYLHNKTNIGGGEQSLTNLWMTLNKEEYSPHLVLPQNGLFGELANRDGIPVDYCSVPRLMPKNFLKIIKACRQLQKICFKENIDIIHSYTPRNNILASIIGRIFRVPVIWHERNMIFGGEYDISRKFMFLPDKIICNSNAVASRFEKQGKVPPKVKTILNGVDTQRFKPGSANQDFIEKYNLKDKMVVGLLSNLDKRKQPESFLKACPKVLKALPNTVFLIVGGELDEESNGRRAELELLTADLNISKNVHFTGFLSEIEKVIGVFNIGVAVTEKEACAGQY